MQSFKKHTLIPLDPRDPLSISLALAQYRQQLQQGTILRQGMFDIEFVAVTDSGNRRLQIDDLQDPGLRSLLQEALSLGPDSEGFMLPPLISDECDLYLSEPLMFAIAMQHSRLAPALLATAEAMIDFARRHNDLQRMWLDDSRIFGVEALFLLARRTPELAWLLARFLIPAWDNVYSNGYEQYMARLLELNGWSPDMLRAFVWCDSDHLRQGFFYSGETGIQSHQPLADFLKQNPQQYPLFKQLLSERLLNSPKLLAAEDRPLGRVDAVLYVFVSMYPIEFAWFEVEQSEGLDTLLESQFIRVSLEEEISDLRAAIESQASGALACYRCGKTEIAETDADEQEGSYQDEDDERPGRLLRLLKPLILAQPQGAALWQYLRDGSQSQALAAQQPIALIPACKAKALGLYHYIVDYCVTAESNRHIAEELSSILSDSRYELLYGDEEDVEAFADILPSKSLQQRQQQYLRLLDIWFAWLGKPELEEIRENLVDDEGLLDDVQYLQRYGNLSDTSEQALLEAQLAKLLQQWNDKRQVYNRPLLNKTLALFRQHRQLANPDNWPLSQMELGHYVLLAFLWQQDSLAGCHDATSRALSERLNANSPWELLAGQVLQQAADDAKPLKTFICRPESSLCELEALQLAQDQLYRRGRDNVGRQLPLEPISDFQPKYLLLDKQDGFRRGAMLCYFLLASQHVFTHSSTQPNEPQAPALILARRLWQWLLELAPLKLLHYAAMPYSDDNFDPEFDSDTERQGFVSSMQSLGVSEALLTVFDFQLSLSSGDGANTLRALTQLSPLTQASSSQADPLLQALRRLPDREKLNAFELLELQFPGQGFIQHPELQREWSLCLEYFIRDNLKSWQRILAQDFDGRCQLLERGIKQPVVAAPQLVVCEQAQDDRYDWLNVSLLRRQGEELQALLLTQAIPPEGLPQGVPGEVLLFDESVSAEEILAAFKALYSADARVALVNARLQTYLSGELPLAAMQTCLQRLFALDELSIYSSFERYDLKQFLWLLPTQTRQRLLQLLLGYQLGFELFDKQLLRAFMADKVRRGDWPAARYIDRRYQDSDELQEAALSWLLQTLEPLRLEPMRLLRFCLGKGEYEAPCDWVVAQLRNGTLTPLITQLTVNEKIELIDCLEGDYPDAAELLSALANDGSRRVRDAMAGLV
jgi:hypothetical protein